MLAKLNIMMNANGHTVSGLYRISIVDWLLAEKDQFSSATALRFVDLDGLTQYTTMGPLNTRFVSDVCWRARELIPQLRKSKFEANQHNEPNNKHNKLYRQVSKPPGQTRAEYSRDYPRSISVEDDVRWYKGLDTQKGDSLFADYDLLDIKNAKYLIMDSSD